MGKTFVYNMGSPSDEFEGTISLTYGLFFDGTLNNRRNTEIRKKLKGIDEYKGQTATEEEKKIYRKYAMERKAKHLWWKKTEIGDNSYFNDFTNVARKYMCCDKKKYAIYVEGIGTVNEKGDDSDGYGWGRGTTGIIVKVRSGCKQLADKVKIAKNNNDKIKNLIVTIDIFGFSRGAAAARNFAYNLQKKAYAPGTYVSPGMSGAVSRIDHDGYSIKESWLKDGLLPPMGHLGTALLDAGIERELVDRIKISVRFLGVYDTVASYDPENLIPNFKKHIGKLHLHELGNPRRAVHFTAMDEHRENFSLTPLKQGVEKEFPGVHSDIGGSYDNGTEVVKELETSWGFQSSMDSFKQELLANHWYLKEQLKYKREYYPAVGAYWALRGTRYLKKTYSYIPLHFMVTYLLDSLWGNEENPMIEGKLEKDYSIEDDKILVGAKKRLRAYVFSEEGGKKWEFKSDREWEEQKQKREIEKIQRQMEEINEKAEEMLEKAGKTEPEEEKIEKSLDGIIVTAIEPQYLLRELRRKYLHWSATREGVGMDPYTDSNPTKTRKRQKF